MSVIPDPPLPGEHWKNLWNFSTHYLDENERKQVDQTWEAMKNAINTLQDLYPILGNKNQAPEDVKKFVQDIHEAQRDMLPILHCLTEMLEDPYELEKKQLKLIDGRRKKSDG